MFITQYFLFIAALNGSLYTAYCTEQKCFLFPVFTVTGYFKKPHSKTKHVLIKCCVYVCILFSIGINPMQYRHQVWILMGLTYSIVVCTSLNFIV